MSGFNFDIVLYLNDFNTTTIKPPFSLNNLKEVAKEKFNIPKIDLYFYDLDEEKIDLKSDSDYFELFNYVEENELSEIVIHVHSDDKLKKKVSNRKNSRAHKLKNDISRKLSGFVSEKGGSNVFDDDEDDNLNDFRDVDDEKDLRNLKYNEALDEGIKYSKHGYNAKNQARIEFIKEKKQIMREEAEKKHKERLKEEELKEEAMKEIHIDEDFGKKNKNKRGNKVKTKEKK